jgi:hypothetical protein
MEKCGGKKGISSPIDLISIRNLLELEEEREFIGREERKPVFIMGIEGGK